MTTLLSLVEALARDPEEKAAYTAAPDAYLERHGFGDLTPAEVNEAVAHSADTLPPPVAAQMQPGDGLNGVAAVDPEAFDPTVAQQYEDDLFGHDDALDPNDPALHGFEDGGFEDAAPAAQTDGAEESGGTDGPDGADGLDDADGARPEAAATVGDGTDGADSPEGTATPERSLADLSDPHGLDIDAPAQAAGDTSPAGQTTQDAAASTSPPPETIEGEEGSGQGPESAGDSRDAFAGPVADLVEDPFAADPLGSAEEPWYQQGPGESFDVEIDEPESDILDDVDDLGYDD